MMMVRWAHEEAQPFRQELRERRLAAIAAKALRGAGIESIDELYAMPRFDLLRVPGVGGVVFDYLNDVLRSGDPDRLAALFGSP
jgi:hypothetical protein